MFILTEKKRRITTMILNDGNYVEKAEQVIKGLLADADKESKRKTRGRDQVKIVSTSKLRNILAMSSDIYNLANMSVSENLSEDINSQIEYLKIRIIYEAGRDKDVNDLVTKAKLIECIGEIKGNKKNFIQFNRYLEAIVAYRKYLGGKDE